MEITRTAERSPCKEKIIAHLTMENMPHLEEDEHLAQFFELLVKNTTMYLLSAYMLHKKEETEDVEDDIVMLIRLLSNLAEKNFEKIKKEE